MSLAFPPPVMDEVKVCEKCRLIDLSKSAEALLNTNIHPVALDEIGELITIKDWYSSSCAFCEALRLTLHNLEGVEKCLSENKEVYQLRAFSAYDLYPPALFIRSDDTVCLQLFPPGFSFDPVVFSLLNLKWKSIKHGSLLCRPATALRRCFQPVAVSPTFNGHLVRNWVEKCREFHGKPCSMTESATDLVLIDCIALTLRSFHRPPPYIALSYVWAKTSSGLPQKSDQAGFPPSHGFSKVIRDSISVTKELGFQYLWVDKYCVNQFNEAIKASQIAEMDLIYSGAELTIIAAHGKDEHQGLAGISSPREKSQVFSMGDFIIIREIPELGTTPSAVWRTRGWTFQEHALSHRRLFFLSSQVLFECSEMRCRETRGGAELCPSIDYSIPDYSRSSLVLFPTTDFIDFDLFGSRTATWEDRMVEIHLLIYLYSLRELTFDSDAIRAFAGIQRVFKAGKFPIGFIQGLPVPLHNSCSVEESAIKMSFELCWEICSPKPRRRHQFPSWTWAGWASKVREQSSISNLDKSYLRNITFLHDDGKKLRLSEITQQLRHSVQRRASGDFHPKTLNSDLLQPEAISFRAHLASADCFSFANGSEWESGCYNGAKIFFRSQSSTKGEVGHLQMLTPWQFLHCLENKSMACIILALNHDAVFKLHMLLIEWVQPGEAHRVERITVTDNSEKLPQLEEHINSLPLVDVTLR